MYNNFKLIRMSAIHEDHSGMQTIAWHENLYITIYYVQTRITVESARFFNLFMQDFKSKIFIQNLKP